MGRLSEYDKIEQAILNAHAVYSCPHCGLQYYCCSECGQDLLVEDHLPACLLDPNKKITGTTTTVYTYIFASLRGNDFQAIGKDPLDALQNLKEQEKESGSLWKLNDPHRNEFAVTKQGFTCIKAGDFYTPVYKRLTKRMNPPPTSKKEQ